MSHQFSSMPWLLCVRFEQARGKGGVPKTWLPYMPTVQKLPEAKTLVRQAVQMFRAACADDTLGHGRDLMPGSDDEYRLHNVDGGMIEKAQDIEWETVQVGSPPQAQQRAELVLTWGLPSERLLAATK